MSQISRRKFVSETAAASTVLGIGVAAPQFLQQAAAAQKSDGRILVVVEMAGGNDGLNTIVPYDHDAYRKARPKLALNANEVLKIGDQLGFHPVMTGFADLLEAGRLAIVQGVGYDNPNRSHFESMDIWHTCQRKDEVRTDGWIGRILEQSEFKTAGDPPAMHLGQENQPFALMSRDVRVPSIRSLDQFRLESGNNKLFRQTVKDLADARRKESNDLLGFVQSSTSSAITASERIEAAGMNYKAAEKYASNELATKLQTVARLIDSGLTTPVYYVRIDGFDTHAQQPGAHQSLLRQVSDAVSTFLRDAIAHGHGDRILCMCFSEFGRRVSENASEGTDHGTAGPVFLAGEGVKPGLIGRHPDLSMLEQGDLKHHTDFRRVYATVLENWLHCDSQQILRGNYESVDAISV